MHLLKEIYTKLMELKLKPDFELIVQSYSQKIAEIDDPIRIADFLRQMVIELEQAEGESPEEVKLEAVESKLFDLYRKYSVGLEKDKDVSDNLRKLAFAIDNLQLDVGFSFEIQRAYAELLNVLSTGLNKKPEEPIIRPSKRIRM